MNIKTLYEQNFYFCWKDVPSLRNKMPEAIVRAYS